MVPDALLADSAVCGPAVQPAESMAVQEEGADVHCMPGDLQRRRRTAMTVYVDDAVTLWRGRRWAHLMADTLDELHAFAAALGLPRRAFQDKTSGAHYDVPAELREQALLLGAIPLSRHRERARLRAVIARAKAQGRGERD
jgi:hypothetical protein